VTRIVRVVAVLLIALAARDALAQERQFASDLRREREQIAESCDGFSVSAVGGCVSTLVTSYPFHVALGSLAPQNGFAFGLAFAERYTPNESWRLSWNADAVASPGGSWRGGVYMKLVHTPETSGVIVAAPGTAAGGAPILPREFAVIDLFAQSISLDTINFFGVGPDTTENGRTVYGESQSIVGGTIVYPLGRVAALNRLRAALIGGVTGRFVDVRSGSLEDVPTIEAIYDDQLAPGLSEQKAFVQFQEGLRFKPAIANGRLRLNYLVSAQQFRTSSGTRNSFSRWTLDLQHEIPLYRTVASSDVREFNGPNDCATSTGSPACPPVSRSRNRQGSVNLRALFLTSTTGDENQVPFYFQPTLGGSDLNGQRLLAAYDDYRFRGPKLFAFQESIEHSIWGPVGAFVQFEQGKVSTASGDFDAGTLATSTTVGLTLRAGGFPMVNLSFAWGGEGHHIIGTMNPTLLGGSPRPSLY
jgi:hypothetical protein